MRAFHPRPQVEEARNFGIPTVVAVSFHRFLNERGLAPRAENGPTLQSPQPDGRLATRINQYISNMAARNESGGAAQSAWWSAARPEFIGHLLECPVDEFQDRASQALTVLVRAAHPLARSGLVVLARATENAVPHLAALKLVLSEEQLARFDEAGGDEPIIEERISNVLPKPGEVKKGALVPHPDQAADARVVDEQLKDPAGYWLAWLGLTARPKEPALAKLAVHTARIVTGELLGSTEQAGCAIAEALAGAAGGGSLSVREFSNQVAGKAGIEARQLWTRMTSREPTLDQPRLAVGAEALGRVELVITLDDGVTVRGTAQALAGRYRIRPAGDSEGWVTEVRSMREPSVKEETKPSRARAQ